MLFGIASVVVLLLASIFAVCLHLVYLAYSKGLKVKIRHFDCMYPEKAVDIYLFNRQLIKLMSILRKICQSC